MKKKSVWVLLFMTIVGLLSPLPLRSGEEGTSILFIFDASGSMYQTIENKTKLKTAKEVLSALVGDLPAGTKTGLEAYGHRVLGSAAKTEESCRDIELIVPVQALDAKVFNEKLHALDAKGKTPIAASLKKSAEVLKGSPGNKTIILISDGEETCGGDPVKVAEEIKKEFGADVAIHVIGFDVKEKEKQQLSGIARAGGGTYYSADNAQQLKKSLVRIKKVVVEKAPPKKKIAKKETKVIFRDDFDEDFLSEDWDVQNPDAEAMALDEGKLMLMARAASLTKGNVPNFIVLNKSISPAHYTVTIKLHGEFSQEKYGLGSQYAGLLLYADPKNYLEVWVQNDGSKDIYGYVVNAIQAHFLKNAGGKFSKSETVVPIDWQSERKWTATMPFDAWLRIEKNKYKYTAYASRDGEKWKEIGTIPFLGKKFKPALYADRNKNVPDTLVGFDWFEISEIVKK